MKRILFLVVLTLAAAFVAADVTYTFQGTNWSDAAKEKVLTNGKAFLKEPAFFRIDFSESTNPLMGTGTSLVSKDGQTLYLINPKEKTYSKFDLEEMLKAAGGMMQAMGGMMDIKIENPKATQKRGTQDATIAGFPASHYIVESSYAMKVKVLFMKTNTQVTTRRDLWYTEAFPIGVKDYFQVRSIKSGFGELDKLIELETLKIPGVLLKSKSVSESKDEKGKMTKSYDEFEITAWEKASLGADLFEVPAGYKEVPLLGIPAEEGSEGQEQENPLKNLFK
jgi:hypothetical protein